MRYIYARTSTTDQNVQQQIDYLMQNHNADDVFTDQLSGKTMNRDSLNKLRETVVGGDTIIVQDLSRIGRNTVEVMTLIEELTDKGVKLVIDDLGSIDVTSSAGKMVITTLAAVATMQREQMLEKQAIGIATAKAEGKYKGKQRTQATVDKFEKVKDYIAKGLTVEASCKAAGLGKAHFYRMKKELA